MEDLKRQMCVPDKCSACWVGEVSGKALLPSPFLGYVSSCLHYNKQICSIRLSPVVLAADEHHHLPPWWLQVPAVQETPERWYV